MNIPEAVNLAADIIERGGWWQRNSGDGSGACPVLALALVAENDELLFNATSALAAHLGHPEDDGEGSCRFIFAWNDAPERTQEQAIASMRSCAVIEAARESRGSLSPQEKADAIRDRRRAAFVYSARVRVGV